MLRLPGMHVLESVSAVSAFLALCAKKNRCSVGESKRVYTTERKQILCLTIEAGDLRVDESLAGFRALGTLRASAPVAGLRA